MPAHRKRKSTIEEGMRLIQHCPLCESVYEPLEIKVVDERDDVHLVHVTCPQCNHAVVALIMNQPNGLSSMGLITDAQPDDLQRFQATEAVSWDDCIAVHTILKEDQLCKETFLN